MGDNILHLTDLGLKAALNASASGILIDVESYKIGDSDLNSSDADLDIHGNILIQGTIGYVEVISNNVVRFTFRINPSAIGAGLICKEIGVFLPNNIMFGRCVFDTPLQLIQGETHELSVLLSTTKCDVGVINVAFGSYSSIPSTPSEVTLGPPDSSDFNVVSVLSLIENADGTTSAGVALKFGAGSLQWAFSGYDRIFSGLPNSGASNSEFTATGLLGSVSFQSGEVVLVYVVSGPARGQTRKFYFNSATQTFKLKSDTAFLNFDTTCTVVVWRKLSGSGGSVNTYPPQMTNIPNDWVLTRGVANLPVWAPPKNTGSNLNTLYIAPGRMRVASLNDTGNGTQSRYSLGNIIVKNVNYCSPALGGITQHKTAFDISSAELEFSENIPENTPIDFRLITKEPGTGTYVDIVTNTFTGDGSTQSFSLSQPIESSQYVWAYIEGIRQSTTTYNYDPNSQSIVFVSPIPDGLELECSLFVMKQEEGYSTEVVSTTTVTVGDTLFIELPVSPQTKNHTFVSVSGTHIHRKLYSLVDNMIVLSSAAPGNLQIEVTIFNNVLSNGTPQTNLVGIVKDAVVTHKNIKLLRHDAPDVILPIPQINFMSGAGMRIDGVYPNYKISSTLAEQYTPTTDFKISTRSRLEDTSEIVYTQRITLTDSIRMMICADFSARLGPGFASVDGLEVIQYVIGFRTTGNNEPEYGRDIKGTGVAGFSSLQGVSTHGATAIANASLTQVLDIVKSNVPAGYVDIVVKMRVQNANIAQYGSLLLLDINVLALPVVN